MKIDLTQRIMDLETSKPIPIDTTADAFGRPMPNTGKPLTLGRVLLRAFGAGQPKGGNPAEAEASFLKCQRLIAAGGTIEYDEDSIAEIKRLICAAWPTAAIGGQACGMLQAPLSDSGVSDDAPKPIVAPGGDSEAGA